ncbi:MAG: hypothetical protein RLZZ396_2578 [Planctomycetota bacterium]|jgi:hypothetical protein
MIEPDFPMHEELDRFEQDLKTLTPKPFPGLLPVQAKMPQDDLGLSSMPDVGLLTDNQVHRLPSTNYHWLKIASVSWMMGLAAGVLVSVLWTRLMNEQVPIAEPNLVSQKMAASGATSETPVMAPITNSASTNPFGSQHPRAFGDKNLAGHSRTIATDLAYDYVLQPMMRRNPADLTRWFAGMEIAKQPKRPQADVPHSTAKDSTTPEPSSFPKYQGQRQLLKTLIESNDLISI